MENLFLPGTDFIHLFSDASTTLELFHPVQQAEDRRTPWALGYIVPARTFPTLLVTNQAKQAKDRKLDKFPDYLENIAMNG